jgi:hypothetical protein
MKKTTVRILATAALAAAAVGTFGAVPASAATDNPKACFGQDRAAWIAEHGGAAWGAIAPTRAGDNAAINAAYKASCS